MDPTSKRPRVAPRVIYRLRLNCGGRIFVTTQFLDLKSERCMRETAAGESQPGPCEGV